LASSLEFAMSSPPSSPCCDVQQWRGFVSGITIDSALTNVTKHQESIKASMPPCRPQSGAKSVQFPLPPFISGMRTRQRPVSVGRIGTQGEQDEAAKPEGCNQENPAVATKPEVPKMDLAACARLALGVSDGRKCGKHVKIEAPDCVRCRSRAKSANHRGSSSCSRQCRRAKSASIRGSPSSTTLPEAKLLDEPTAGSRTMKRTMKPRPDFKPCAQISVDRPVHRPAAKAASLPAKALVGCLDDSICSSPTKTPTLTPCSRALRKSELLLAELSALGLSDEDNSGITENEPGSVFSTCEDFAPLKSACSSPARSPTRASLLPRKSDTVEVPVALLDMFVDTWSKYRNLDLESTPKGEAFDGDTSCGTQEPEPEMISSKASSADPSAVDECGSSTHTFTFCASTASPETAESPASPRLSSLCWPHSQPSPATATRIGSPAVNAPGASSPFFPSGKLSSPIVGVKVMPPRVMSRGGTSPRNSWTSGQRAQTHLQTSPGHRSPAFGGPVVVPCGHMSPAYGGSLMVPKMTVESRAGCRPVSCTVQQTVTITNTVHFNF